MLHGTDEGGMPATAAGGKGRPGAGRWGSLPPWLPFTGMRGDDGHLQTRLCEELLLLS